MRRIFWSVLVVWMLVALTEMETRGMAASAAAGQNYTWKDEVTKFKVGPVDFQDLKDADIAGRYLTWTIIQDHYDSIYVLNLDNGKTERLTTDKTHKYNPVLADTIQGPMVLWIQSNELHGSDIWGYNLKSKEKKKLVDGGSSSLTEPVGNGNYLAWVDHYKVQVLNLASGESEEIEEGSNPQLGKGRLIYLYRSDEIRAYDLGSKSEDHFYGASFPHDYSFNGKYIVLKTKLRENQGYVELNATTPSEKGIVLQKDSPYKLSKVFTGLSYGIWVEKGEGDQAKVTGVDLLHKESFSIPLEATYNHVLGLSGDTLIYLNKGGFIVKRTIIPPSTRADRNAEPIHVVMDGVEVPLRTAPISLNNSTYVEFRSLFERMGFGIKWDNKTRQITGTKGSLVIKLTIDKKEMVVNGKVIKTDSAPVTRGGTTYVPLRLIGEAADRKISWNRAKQTVYISLKDTKDTLYNEDGSMRYHGGLVDGIREGYGTQYNENGRVFYEGEWKNDKMDGEGKMYYLFADELYFEGTMRNGKQVEGIEYYPGGGLRYKGSYNESGLHWEGLEVVLNRSTGEYLVVEISQGGREGKAIWYYANDEVKIEGDFADDRFINGTLYDPEGNMLYQGGFDEWGEPLKN